MDYGVEKNICIQQRLIDGTLADDPRQYWDAMPKMRPSRYSDMDDCWILEEDFYLRIGGIVVLIRKGFDFDGASIPKACWAIIGHPMQMWILLAALVHDALYTSNKLPRTASDGHFLEIIQACDRVTPSQRGSWITRVSETNWKWRRRNECWLAVRSFGGFVYPKKTMELEKYDDIVQIIAV